MEYELFDLVIRSASKGLTLQLRNGSFEKGHDGPWNYEDTFLRTTSHWALLIFRAYELTNEKKYRDAAIRACNYLISKEARPFNFTFYCRTINSNKDQCNGLIGQAWVLEALIVIGQQLHEAKYLDIAKEVLLLLPYNFDKHSWSAVDINGTLLGEYNTLNQQIWLTSMAITLGNVLDDKYLLSVGRDFYLWLQSKIGFFTKGLIKHNYSPDRSQMTERISQIKMRFNDKKLYSFQKTVSLGYLPFLLYGIVLAIDNTPEDQIWKTINTGFIIKSLNYIELNFPYGYLENPGSFRWSYNPVGIEMAYILQVILNNIHLFPDYRYTSFDEERISRWLTKQISGYYDFNEGLLIKQTKDPNMLSARFYEAIRLNNYKIRI